MGHTRKEVALGFRRFLGYLLSPYKFIVLMYLAGSKDKVQRTHREQHDYQFKNASHQQYDAVRTLRRDIGSHESRKVKAGAGDLRRKNVEVSL